MKKWKSHGKAVKERKTFKTFVWISSKNSASGCPGGWDVYMMATATNAMEHLDRQLACC